MEGVFFCGTYLWGSRAAPPPVNLPPFAKQKDKRPDSSGTLFSFLFGGASVQNYGHWGSGKVFPWPQEHPRTKGRASLCSGKHGGFPFWAL